MCNLVAQSEGTAEGRFKGELERHLTGKETEPWEIIYFKVYKSQLPICADSLAGANLAETEH